MLPLTPPDRDDLKGTRGRAIPYSDQARPPGQKTIINTAQGGPDDPDDLENEAQQQAAAPQGTEPQAPEPTYDFLKLVREAEQQAALYSAQANRRAWSASYRAFHNEHYVGSKYTQPEWRGRSRLFIPKTRAAVRKDSAAVAASLFNSIDAINCMPGNESDPRQRAAAAVMEELVNYRTDRASGKAAFPWFLLSIGARQNAVLTGVCISKQCWKQDFRKAGTEPATITDDNGVELPTSRDVWKVETDRPDMILIPPENVVIDPAADWTNPAQNSAFLVVKWPMQIEEIKAKQNSPVNPWNQVSETVLKGTTVSTKQDMAAIRRARELGLDRMDETQTGTHFQVIWVYEVFIRVNGDDWTFYSVGDQDYLTTPKPVREVYPEQYGERPITIGYGALEAHRIYPMAPAESWQPLQTEVNDLRNLMLDATKQNVMPVSKVRRGRQIDLDQVRRRSSGSSILVNDKDDVTWETPPAIPNSAVMMNRELELEIDDLAGQQNYGSVETNNALGKTLGGLKLAAGAANAVQEFDIRVWIETWVAPSLAQIVRLEQYYESDKTVLELCGERAQLWQKHGISQIDDDLLEQEISVHVSVGLGAGDPQQRLAKFSTAAQIATPLIQAAPEFQSGQREINIEAIIEEIFGAAGYKDGGKRFFKDNGKPRDNPMADLKTKEILAKIDKDQKTGQAALFTGLSNLAKVALGRRQLESEVVDTILSHQTEAHRMGFDHGHRHTDQILSATDHGHRHGLAIAGHRQSVANDAADRAAQAAEGSDTPKAGEGAGMEGQEPAQAGTPAGAGPPGEPPASSPPPQQQPQGSTDPIRQMLEQGEIEFTRDASGRIKGIKLAGR